MPMTSKPRCANCGAELIMMSTREGVPIGICPHTQPSQTTTIMGILRIGWIYCTKTKSPDETFKKTKKAKCPNCGSELIEMITREGLRMYICPHLPASWTRSISGVIREGYLYCTSKVKGLRSTFETLAKAANGLTIEALRKVTHETIPDADLYENANLAIMLGLPKKQLVELFDAAYTLALGVGIEPTRGIEALCKGIGRRSRLILNKIGITFKPTDAYEWFVTTNKLERSLTTGEKTTAWQQYAIHLIKEKADTISPKIRNLAKS